MADTHENTRAAASAKQAAHSRRFVWSMTGIIILFFVGIAATAFFVLSDNSNVAESSGHNEQQKSGAASATGQASVTGLSVENAAQVAPSSTQATGSAQAALQGSAPLNGSTSGGANVSSPVASPPAAIQNAGTATPSQVNAGLLGGVTGIIAPTPAPAPVGACGAHPPAQKGGPVLFYPDICALYAP